VTRLHPTFSGAYSVPSDALAQLDGGKGQKGGDRKEKTERKEEELTEREGKSETDIANFLCSLC